MELKLNNELFRKEINIEPGVIVMDEKGKQFGHSLAVHCNIVLTEENNGFLIWVIKQEWLYDYSGLKEQPSRKRPEIYNVSHSLYRDEAIMRAVKFVNMGYNSFKMDVLGEIN